MTLTEEFIKQFDIVITNPPFSIKTQYLNKFKNIENWYVGLLLFHTNKTFKSQWEDTYMENKYCGKLKFVKNGEPYSIIGSPIFYYYKPGSKQNKLKIDKNT